MTDQNWLSCPHINKADMQEVVISLPINGRTESDWVMRGSNSQNNNDTYVEYAINSCTCNVRFNNVEMRKTT